jgi:deazaflavin-dependent oxidoreductase (nitroreductase family)
MTEEPRDRDQKVVEEFRANGGAVGGTYAEVPLLLLHHTGAKSGAARITPLAYIGDGQNWVIFAANSGAPTHPGWYHNLCRNPAAAVELASGTYEVTARIAQGTGREVFLDRFRQSSPYFAGFEKATQREIPVVVLERTQP